MKTLLFAICLVIMASSARALPDRISELSQFFDKPGADVSPWIFIPEDNIREFSTAEYPGLATIWQNGKGTDIKGILSEPIPIDKYKMPWNFQLGLVQNYMAMLGVGSKQQMNYAIGLNVAVTFSDPAEWPKDRTIRPPDTRDFQLLVVHLGSTGEFNPGLPQFATNMHPETYLLWGRGDLGYEAMGDWKLSYFSSGAGPNYGGPASPQIYFRCIVQGPTSISVGFKYEEGQDFFSRTIDCSRYGNITGIWEIGPIFSCDRWIPDELVRQLPIDRGAYPILTGKLNEGKYEPEFFNIPNPDPVPPDPVYEFYIDYCAFMSGAPAPFEELTSEFNIPGYMGELRGVQIPVADTHTRPGYLTITLLGPSQGAWWGPNSAYNLDLDNYPPPWEIETCFIPPDESVPWNLFLIMVPQGAEGKTALWEPAVANDPAASHPVYRDMPFTDTLFEVHRGEDFFKSPVEVVFPEPLPEEIMSARPLYWLIQMLDRRRARIGFRADPEKPWHLSEPCDLSKYLNGGDVEKFKTHAWGSVTGRHFGQPAGSPMYQRLHIDYVRYRYGLSTD